MTLHALIRKYTGRDAGGRPGKALVTTTLALATLDECLEAGYCECGQSLATHRPVAEPPRLASWMTLRSLDQSLSGVARANAAQGWSLNDVARFENTRP